MGPIGVSNTGWKLYLWILVGDICFVLFVYFLCLEATNLSLEQLDDVFGVAVKYTSEEKVVQRVSHERQRKDHGQDDSERLSAGRKQIVMFDHNGDQFLLS